MKKIFKILTSFFLAFVFAFLMPVNFVQAGTDLLVTCTENGPCDIAPAATPLFSEANILPGDSFTQTVTVRNFDVNDTCDLVLDVTDAAAPAPVNLAEEIFAAISDGVTNYAGSQIAGEVQPGFSYQDLYDAGPISLGSLAPLNTRIFTWYAQFDFNAGNEFQLAESSFDFEIAISCDGGSTTTTTSSSDGGTSSGGTSEPSAPKCTEPKPEGVANLSVTNIASNAVSLSWTAVYPSTHYALEFYRVSDGAAYGATNIGNVTSYTVTNLSGGGDSYRFFVRAINECAPGELSNESVITPFGGITTGRPLGEGGEVLGTTDPSPEPESSSDSELSQVLGASTCNTLKFYIPWILLIIQGFLILVADYLLRKDERRTKHYLAIALTFLSILIFYLIKECNCYSEVWWLLAWLCKWYFVASLLLTAVLKAINYAFIEETEVKEKAPKKTK